MDRYFYLRMIRNNYWGIDSNNLSRVLWNQSIIDDIELICSNKNEDGERISIFSSHLFGYDKLFIIEEHSQKINGKWGNHSYRYFIFPNMDNLEGFIDCITNKYGKYLTKTISGFMPETVLIAEELDKYPKPDISYDIFNTLAGYKECNLKAVLSGKYGLPEYLTKISLEKIDKNYNIFLFNPPFVNGALVIKEYKNKIEAISFKSVKDFKSNLKNIDEVKPLTTKEILELEEVG